MAEARFTGNNVTNIEPLDISKFEGYFWKKSPSFYFAAQETVCPIGINELSRAMLGMPLGFIKHQDKYRLVAILGLNSGHNQFIDTGGSWRGAYVPALLNHYPFSVQKEGHDYILQADLDSQCIVSEQQKGNLPLYKPDGSLSDPLTSIKSRLVQLDNGMRHLNSICRSLAEQGLIGEWPIEYTLPSGLKKRVNGLYGIDQEVFSSLTDEAFLELRHSGSLAVCYCQLMSKAHIQPLLQQLIHKSDKDLGELVISPSGSDGLNFDNL